MAVKKETLVLENRYNQVKEKFIECEQRKANPRVVEKIEVGKLTKAQKALLELENKFHIFNGLSQNELLTVVENIRLLRIEKGEKVFSINHTSKDMFFVVGGGIDIIINDVIVASLPKGSFFGEMAYIRNQPRSATAQVKTPVAIILSFNIKEDIGDVKQALAFKKLYKNINSMLVEKLEGMNKRVSK
jgi:CRP-like cAMP-binding protein